MQINNKWIQLDPEEYEQLAEHMGEAELRSRLLRLTKLKKENKRPQKMKSDTQALYAMAPRPVEAIKDKETLQRMKLMLKESSDRDYFLFVLGLNSGLRVSDLISLRAGDVRGRKHIELREKDKLKHFPLNKATRILISDYTSSMTDDDYLFTSAKTGMPIRRDRAYKVLKQAAQAAGVENFGTHTLRKTFGYHFYQQYEDETVLQNLFNHSSRSVTLRYIGITQEEIEESHEDFSL